MDDAKSNDGLKRRRCELSDDEDRDALSCSRKWDDPDILEEMGVSKLGSDISSSDESDLKEIVDSEGSENSENDNRPTKKRKLNDRRTRQPLREKTSSLNVLDANAKIFKECSLKKLKPSQCVIKNSQVVYSGSTSLKNSKNKRTDDSSNSDFKLSRLSLKKDAALSGTDCFLKVPDEVLVEIFKNLDRKALVTCSYVSRRFNRVSKEESLWCRINLGGRTLPKGALDHILKRGPLVLRLAFATIPSEQFMPYQLPSCFSAKVQYLDLSMSSITTGCLAKLLGYCFKLKKLSLENCIVNNKVLAAVAANTGLEVVNLTMCSGIGAAGLSKVLTRCLRLQSINISWTGLNKEAIDVVAQYLPKSVERLNISGCRHLLKDHHVKELLQRCDKLVELDISDCIDLTAATVEAIQMHGLGLEYLAVSRCYSIHVNSLTALNKMESLIYLDMFGLVTEAELKEIKVLFTTKKINQFTFSSVARPTVGIRRTSIWGLRVRDESL